MKHHAKIAHHTKGRLRVSVPTAKGNPKALEAMKRSLAGLTGVHEVEVNELTGSIVVNYDPKRHIDFQRHLNSEGSHKSEVSIPEPPALTEVDELAEQLEKEAEYLASHSQTAKVVFDFVRKCDLELKKATGNQVDLKVLAPLGLAVYAFLEMGIEASTPVWLTLGLFSFNHFVDLHTHHDHPAGASSQQAPVRRRRPVRSF